MEDKSYEDEFERIVDDDQRRDRRVLVTWMVVQVLAGGGLGGLLARSVVEPALLVPFLLILPLVLMSLAVTMGRWRP